MSNYKTGERLRSRVSTVQVVVVRAADFEGEITCDGVAFARDGEDTGNGPASAADGPKVEMGKRYEDAAATVELLCVSPGSGQLACAGSPLNLKAPKPLPASD